MHFSERREAPTRKDACVESYNPLRYILFSLLFMLIVTCEFPLLPAYSQNAGAVRYVFKIDEDGLTFVDILYNTSQNQGSMWVLVPRFTRWINKTLRGEVTEWSLRDSYGISGFSNPFYEALFFSFKSEGLFEMEIQYNHSLAAMIIEPDGIFFSPQIGFKKGNKAEIIIQMPKAFVIKRDEVAAFGSSSIYSPSSIDRDRNVVSFKIPETETLMRVEIGFETGRESADLIELHSGIFTFETPRRYLEYARNILRFYNQTYDDLVDLFNVTLENARVVFFLPEFDLLLNIGGYVPFTSEKLGDIHINILYTRTIEGEMEVIALHELVHHFLWKTGISPKDLLWFHEGMAQYVSIEICNEMGYEGALLIKQQIQERIPEAKAKFRNDFGFLQGWSPQHIPQDIGRYYIAAYYIVSELSEQHGGLDYYKRFFKLMRGKKIKSNSELGYYLSLAAEESVTTILNSWGFDIPDLYRYSSLLNEVRSLVEGVSRLFEPYRSLAEALYRNAVFNADRENEARMKFYLASAVLIAKLAPLLTLITVMTFIFCSLLWFLKTKKVL